MRFSKENYEPYALDYIEGTLDPAMLEKFEEFLQKHPGIRSELIGFEMHTLVPDDGMAYPYKSSLYRRPTATTVRYIPWLLAAAILILGIHLMIGDHAADPPTAEHVEHQHADVPQPSRYPSAQEASPPLTPVIERQSSLVHTLEPQGPGRNSSPQSSPDALQAEQPIRDTPPTGTSAVDVSDRVPVRSSSTVELPQIADEERLTTPPDMMPSKTTPYIYHDGYRSIEVIHPQLILRLSTTPEEKSKVSELITQVNLVPTSLRQLNSKIIKKKLLPEYLTAQ